MKKVLIFLTVALIFSSFACRESTKEEKVKREVEEAKIKLDKIKTDFNSKAKNLLVNDIHELTHQLFTNKLSTREDIKIKELLDKKLTLLKKIIGDDNSEIADTAVECANCAKNGPNPNCPACGGDGWGSTENDNPKECKACGGDGNIGSEPCSVCKGLGWANSTPNGKD